MPGPFIGRSARLLALSGLLVGAAGCGGAEPAPQPTEPASEAEEPADGRAASARAEGGAQPALATLRRALDGVPLTDEEVRFLHRALRRSDTPYTERGLATYAEWELTAEVQVAPDGRWRLRVAGPRVNAEWELRVDRETGAVEEGALATDATEAPAPEPF
jgi:hypothetical protein